MVISQLIYPREQILLFPSLSQLGQNPEVLVPSPACCHPPDPAPLPTAGKEPRHSGWWPTLPAGEIEEVEEPLVLVLAVQLGGAVERQKVDLDIPRGDGS